MLAARLDNDDLEERLYKRVPKARNMRSLFHEPAVYGRGTKWKKGYEGKTKKEILLDFSHKMSTKLSNEQVLNTNDVI